MKNVGSNHLDDDVKFTVTRGKKSCDITVSVLTYARSCVLYGEGNVIKLAQALYLYNQAAVAKFGK